MCICYKMSKYQTVESRAHAKMKLLEQKMQLNETYNAPIAKILEGEQQARLFGEAIQTKERPTYGDFIVSSNSLQQKPRDIYNLLLQVADQPNAKIVNDLLIGQLNEDIQLKYIQTKWGRIKHDIVKNLSNVTPEELANFIIEQLPKAQAQAQPAQAQAQAQPQAVPLTPVRSVSSNPVTPSLADFSTPVPATPALSKSQKRKQNRHEAIAKSVEQDIAREKVSRARKQREIFSPAQQAEKDKQKQKTTTGKGVGNKRVKSLRFLCGGGGYEPLEEGVLYDLSKKGCLRRLNKMFIDVDKLEDNKISLKYVSTRNTVNGFSKTRVSDSLRDAIKDLLDDVFVKKDFEKLTKKDKAMFLRFCDTCHINVGISSQEEIKKASEILLGEIRAGNDGAKKELTDLVNNSILGKQINLKLGLKILEQIR